jgi:putative two-component system hydrogenase maturation factor HypX/HoxX
VAGGALARHAGAARLTLVRILLLARSFNCLTQRLFVELAARGHELSVEFDIADSVTEEAVALFRPELIVAPFLKRAIPASVWQRHRCLIVHPGIVGDRGPSALDWAIHNDERDWGVTVLQAEAEMDAGPVWASASFAVRVASKSSLYRHEVTEAAVEALLAAIDRVRAGDQVPLRPVPGSAGVRGIARPLMRQETRRIDWAHDNTNTVLRKLRAADGAPGVLDALFGVPCFLFDAQRAAPAPGTAPGAVCARSGDGLVRATVDGAIWIGHCRRADRGDALKLPVVLAFAGQVASLPAVEGAPVDAIRYEERGGIGVLHFAFYNGAMSTAQCQRLLAAYREALVRPTRAIVLAGGPDFFSNGIHLNVIEAAVSPADESMRNIEAIDDVCGAIIESTDRITIAALQGNAGAGGCFLAFACDEVWTRPGVLLNPHYRNMGNLYGSEYWTYTLPRRVRHGPPGMVMAQRLPLGSRQAQALGLVDAVFEAGAEQFLDAVVARAATLAAGPAFAERIAAKRERRASDEESKPLASYREEELDRMHRNFYGFDPSYHYARSNFVHKVPPAWTPRHLAAHRAGTAPRAT